jgi:gluconate 2-dehydrogenase gamma chain
MACKSHWSVGAGPIDPESAERRFFDAHEWETVEAATARIIPTDHEPGAREAGVVRFIDHYLSGIDYVYATADGSGFLRMDGRIAETWQVRVAVLQGLYREGVRELDARSEALFGRPFKALTEDEQDRTLEALSGAPKPEVIPPGRAAAYGTTLQSVSDEDLPFFSVLTLHTRQGFYGDPVYGGNRERCGWQVIGFPGPESLKSTNDLSYSVEEYLVHDVDWTEVLPHLREGNGASA